jgi:serine/threonine protein kinase/predicted ATPase
VALEAGTRLGPYEILAPLGAGGMGEVYRARDPRLERDVAVKVLPEELRRDESRLHRFEREARAAGALNHPNILVIHEVGTHENSLFVVSELLQGVTLRERLGRGPCGMDEAVGYAAQVGRGLVAAHAKGIIHRDLKPENLFLTTDGRVKILDFGLAKVKQPSGTLDPEAETESATAATEPGTVMGTPGYMSPEQVRGQPVDHRSDMFSFGVVLYELLGGSHPFGRETPTDALAAILDREPADLGQLKPELPAALVGVVNRCLEKEPWRRFATAQELVEELERSLSEDAESAPSVTGPEFLSRGGEAPPEEPAFVAREEELARLMCHLERALSGEGRVVFVTGEAGSGKTALASEFTRRAQRGHSDLVVASGRCNAHTGVGDPYLPFREVLGLLTGDVQTLWSAGAISRDHALRLWQVLPDSAGALVDSGPDLIDTFVPGRALIARAGGGGGGGRPAWLVRLRHLVEQKAASPALQTPRQTDLFEQYARVLHAVAAERPVLLLLDDLQWADAGSINLLFHLGRQIRGSRVLIAGIYRPSEVALGRDGERHPLAGVVNELKRDLGDIEIALAESESLEFVSALLDAEPNRLSQRFRETLYAQTGGHPLFTVELLRGMREQGALAQDEVGRWVEGETLDWRALPARVEAVIGERIARLPEELRDVLTVAAVEGEVFTAEVVAGVRGIDERRLVGVLSSDLDRRHRLVRAQGVRRLSGGRLSLYRFRHILFQKYIHNSLDDVERSRLHEDVGTMLEGLYGDQAARSAVQLARHFEEAGVIDKAAEYLRQAGEMSARLSAHGEAIAHFRKALGLLKGQPDTLAASRLELALLLDLAAPIMAVKGWNDPELRALCHRARELCSRVEDPTQLFRALFFLSIFHCQRGENKDALEVCQRYSALAEQSGAPGPAAAAHWVSGVTLIALGELARAQTHLEAATTLSRPEERRSLALAYTADPGTICLSWSSYASWFLGYPEQSAARMDKALVWARELDHPMTSAITLILAASMHRLRRDASAVRRHVEALTRISAEHQVPAAIPLTTLYRGWVLVQEGRLDDGIADMHQCLAIWRAVGSVAYRTKAHCALAEAYVKAGRVAEGLEQVSEGVAVAHATGERYYEPELHRLCGELLQMQGASDAEVAASYLHAIEIAEGQQARSWELRATTSLARLWQKQGRTEKARQQLGEIYDWFTEGFDTADLKDAKALLDDLSGSPA